MPVELVTREGRRKRFRQYRSSDGEPIPCERCGAFLDDASEWRLGLCLEFARVYSSCRKGVVFLVVEDPSDQYRGGHFQRANFIMTLEMGYWPTGMVVEKWKDAKPVGRYIVMGEQVLEFEEQAPEPQTLYPIGGECKGDGLMLLREG